MPRLPLASYTLGPITPEGELPLLTGADLTFTGSFRLPRSSNPDGTYNSGARVIAAPGNGTLFVSGHNFDPYIGQINIQTPRILAPGAAVSGLLTASVAQASQEVFGGKWFAAGYPGGAATMVLGGILPRADGRLLGCNYVYYDASYVAILSHYVTYQDFSLANSSTVVGPLGVQTSGVPYTGGASGWYANTMCPIPAEWQSQFEGDTILSGLGLSISGRTSAGPSATVVTAADFGVVDPVPGVRLLGYSKSLHNTLGDLNIWNFGAQQMGGVVFPSGTRTIAYFGTFGEDPDYGAGTDILCHDYRPACWDGTVYSTSPGSDPDNPHHVTYWIYDPVNGNKGYHAYPYSSWYWFYDALDLLRVKAGEINYWDVLPYEYGPITGIPFQVPPPDDGNRIYGATYDPTTKIIYFSAQSTDGGYPIIHSYTIPY